MVLLETVTPQEAAVESLGPVDDGTESLGDVPSLSEEVAGIKNLKDFYLKLWRNRFQTEDPAFKML